MASPNANLERSGILPCPKEVYLNTDMKCSGGCQGKLDNGKVVYYHPVGNGIKHPFHLDCVQPWWDSIPVERHRCPVCQIPIVLDVNWKNRALKHLKLIKPITTTFLTRAFLTGMCATVAFWGLKNLEDSGKSPDLIDPSHIAHKITDFVVDVFPFALHAFNVGHFAKDLMFIREPLTLAENLGHIAGFEIPLAFSGLRFPTAYPTYLTYVVASGLFMVAAVNNFIVENLENLD